MTDQDESRSLSRREIRLREMAAAGVAPEQQTAQQALVSEPEPISSEPSVEIDIPLFDENGRQRSRRELRELREQALAALVSAETVQPETVLPETVAFDVIADQQVSADAHSLSSETVAEEPVAAPEAAEVILVAPDEAAAAVVVDEAEPVDEDEGADKAEAIDEAKAEPVDEAEAVDEAESDADDAALDAEQESGFAAPISAAPSQGYSFPDIAPLDEAHSIFDDPALRVMGAQGKVQADGGRDFDDLITRAVAQEGAASTTNTSALILPSMPETEGLAGPIGETGELFVTGSFELPKSLSETGGHATLHDSVDADPLDDLGFVETTPTGMMAPVSASRAISARSEQGPLVIEATKDKSKIPVVLIATGGVLVLGAAGLIVWAATSGLFG